MYKQIIRTPKHLAIFFIKEYKPEKNLFKSIFLSKWCVNIYNNNYSYACKNSSAEYNFLYKKYL